MKALHVDDLQISFRKKKQFDPTADGPFEAVIIPRVACYRTAYMINYAGSPPVARVFDDNALTPDFLQLKIENWVFYTGGYDIGRIVDDFKKQYNVSFSHNMQIDICYDSDEFVFCGQFSPKQFITSVLAGDVCRERKFNSASKRVQALDKIDVKGTIDAQTLYLSKSNVALKLYNKTVELKHSGKQYIVDSWGSTNGGDVWRLELSIKNEAMRNTYFNGVCLRNFEYVWRNDEYLSPLYFKLILQYYTMRVRGRGYWHKEPILSRKYEVLAYNIECRRRAVAAPDLFRNNSYTAGIQHTVEKMANGVFRQCNLLSTSDLATLNKAAALINFLRSGGAHPVQVTRGERDCINV